MSSAPQPSPNPCPTPKQLEPASSGQTGAVDDFTVEWHLPARRDDPSAAAPTGRPHPGGQLDEALYLFAME
jgi:hypothetical protein